MNGSVNGKAMAGHFEALAWFYESLVLMAGHCMVTNIAVAVTITVKHRLVFGSPEIVVTILGIPEYTSQLFDPVLLGRFPAM